MRNTKDNAYYIAKILEAITELRVLVLFRR
jgi:hypothetical protein